MKTTNKIIIILILSVFFKFKTYSQGLNPFIDGPFYEHCSKVKAIENDKFLVLQNVMEPPVGGFTTHYSEIASKSFSQICLSNNKGYFKKCLAFPDNDSTYYFAEYFEILENGKIAIGGNINPPNNSVTPFFAIVNQNLDSFELIKTIPFLTDYMVSFNTKGNNIYLSTEAYVLKYDISGSFISNYAFNSDTLTNPFYYDNSFFAFNNKLYYHFQNLFANQDENYIAVLDENYNIELFQTTIFSNRPSNLNIRLAKRGLALNSENYFISGIFNTPGVSTKNYPAIFKLDTANSFEILFVDSTVEKFGNTPLYIENQIDIFNKDNIYVSFPISNTTEEGLIVYSINENGFQNWKQKILLDNALEFPLNTTILANTLVVNDKNELFLTIEVKDNFNKKDVYIIKLDSLGNPSDFETGIFSFGPKLEINDFALFPNPVQNKLSIETALKGNFKLNVFDVLGKQITTYAFENSATLNVEKLNQGIYFYTISNQEDKQLQEGKFLKE